MADINLVYIWLFIGVVFVGLELFGVSGVGFLFAGFGAITVGAIMELGYITPGQTIAQFLVFFLSTTLWTTLLWKPLRRRVRQGSNYQNIVGDTAFVGSEGLTKHRGGEVTWSGTIMQAMIDTGVDVDTISAGSEVVIVGVTGATLLVKPKY